MNILGKLGQFAMAILLSYAVAYVISNLFSINLLVAWGGSIGLFIGVILANFGLNNSSTLLKARVEQLQSVIDNQGVNSGEVAKVLLDLQNTENELINAQTDYNSAKTVLTLQQTECEKANQTINGLRTELEKAKTDKNEAETKANTWAADCSNSSETVKQMNRLMTETSESYKAEITALNEKITNAKSTITEYERALSDVAAKVPFILTTDYETLKLGWSAKTKSLNSAKNISEKLLEYESIKLISEFVAEEAVIA